MKNNNEIIGVQSVEKWTGWGEGNVVELNANNYVVLYENEHIPQTQYIYIQNIKKIYTARGRNDYVIVVALNDFYIGSKSDDCNIITCFAKLNSLKEACEAL